MRTSLQRAQDETRVEHALSGKLWPSHNRRLHTKVAGVTCFNDDGTSRQDAIRHMAQFDSVELVREPHNQFDSMAIRVMGTVYDPPSKDRRKPVPEPRRVQIGFIAADVAEEIAPSMDAGEKWAAWVSRIDHFYNTWGVGLIVFRAAPGEAKATGCHCKKCGYDWKPRKAAPKECPHCKSRTWSRDPVPRSHSEKQIGMTI
jgi:HIRAN domain